MFLILTPNPALDRTMVIPGIRPGAVLRTDQVLVVAGGKGLNVARAAHTLGQPTQVCAPLGGATGQIVARLAAEEGLSGVWSWHNAGETRTCILLVDPQGGDATALNEVGPTLGPGDWQAFVATALAAAETASLVAISGSLPPGVPPPAMGDLVRVLAAAGRRVIVDSSGPALVSAIEAAPYAVKVNAVELGAALGLPVNNPDQAMAALAALHTRNIALAAVSLGAQGALAHTTEGGCWVRPPSINVISSVGSGDSLLAGLATGLLRGGSLADALRLGVACGSADALSIGGGRLDLAEVERIRAAATVSLY